MASSNSDQIPRLDINTDALLAAQATLMQHGIPFGPYATGQLPIPETAARTFSGVPLTYLNNYATNTGVPVNGHVAQSMTIDSGRTDDEHRSSYPRRRDRSSSPHVTDSRSHYREKSLSPRFLSLLEHIEGEVHSLKRNCKDHMFRIEDMSKAGFENLNRRIMEVRDLVQQMEGRMVALIEVSSLKILMPERGPNLKNFGGEGC